MALEKLLEALGSRFDKQTVRSLIAAYRNFPLLWKELELHDLPRDWAEIAQNDLKKWHPGFLTLAYIEVELPLHDYCDLGVSSPVELTELAEKIRETIRATGLEPANLRDAASLVFVLRNDRINNGSWEAIAGLMAEGKTPLSAWKSAFLALPWMVPDALDAIKALTREVSQFSNEELSGFLVDLAKTTAIDEKAQYEFLSKVLEKAPLALQVNALGKLRGMFDNAFIELLANSFLIGHNRTRDGLEAQSSHEVIENHQNLAMLSQYAGKTEKARVELDQAISVIRHNQALQLRRLATEFENVNSEEARQLWEQVLELEPNNASHRREYAEFLVKQNEPDFALDLLNKNSDEATTALLALRYPELREQTDEITQALENVISRKNLPSLGSRFVEGNDNFKAAEYAFGQKKYAIASDFIHKALKERPNDLETIRLAAKIDTRLANLDEAIDSSALLAMFEPDNKTNNRELARLYQQTQQDSKALEVYENLIFDQGHVDREDFLNYSEIAIKAGKPELAIPIAESFLAKDQLDGEAFVLLCRALIASGRKSEAISLLEQTSALAPEKPTSWLALAQTWIDLDDRDQAMLALRKAKTALPGEPQILTTLGRLYLENEETTDAIAVLRQANQADPQNQITARLLAEAWLKQGYIPEAKEALAAFETDYESDPELALSFGKVSLANQDEATAQKMLKFAWQSLKRDDALTAYANALLRINKKHPDSNRLELAQLLDAVQSKELKNGDDFELALLHTDLKAANALNEEAYSEYLKLLDDPRARSPRAYHHLQSQIGKTASALGLKDVALASLQEAVITDPDNLETRHLLARTYCDSNLQEEAFNTARAALQIAPSDVDNILWFSSFMNGHENQKESIQVLKDAVHLRPDNEILYLTLARTYAQIDEIEETKATLNKMLTLESISTKEYIDVANLYLNLNETAEASAVIMKAISNNPQPDFEETKDLVYSILRLGDAAAALQLVLNLKDSIGSHPCYQILLSDVQVANRQFIPALENLTLVLQKLEFAADETCFESQRFVEDNLDYPAYDKAGFYYRLAQLERTTGDLLAAQKHADLAQKEDPEHPAIIVLQAGLALSLRNSQKLEFALDFLAQEPNHQDSAQELARIIALDAAIESDTQKLSMIWDYFISKQPPSFFQSATAAFLADDWGEKESLQTHLASARQHLEARNAPAFDISEHFNWIWAGMMTFLAAWTAQDWSLANSAIRQVLQTVRVNPVANQLLAAYLSDNQRQHNNAGFIHISKHIPELYTNQDALELLEEHIALAGRFLKPSALLPSLKVGQAVFNGHWDDEEEMQKLVLSPRQAASVLSILVNPVRIDEIMQAFGASSQVMEQKAILALHHEPAQSRAIVETLLKKDSDNPVLHAIHAFAYSNQPDKATQSIEAALAVWNNEPDWHVFAANMYQDTGDYAQAALHLEEALRIAPKSAHYWQLLGDVKLLEKDYHAAKDYFGKASDLFPSNPEALDSLARINQKLGEHAIAIQCWQKAAQLDPNKPDYRISIGESHLASKDYALAIEEAEKVLFNHPGNEKALLIIANAQLQAGRHQEAKKTIKTAKTIAHDSIPFELLEIEIDGQSKPTFAMQAAQMLAENHPDNPMVLNRLANYQINAGSLDKAQTNLNNSLSVDPANAETLIYLGKVARLKGQLDQAIAQLNQAIKLDPSQIDAYLEMGQTFQDRREVANAIETYHKAIDMIEKDPRPYIQASAAYKESRDYRNAEFMLRQAAQLSPSDQSIRRQLAAVVALNLVNNLQEAPKRK